MGKEPQGMQAVISAFLKKNDKLKLKIEEQEVISLFRKQIKGLVKQVEKIEFSKGLLYVKFSSAVLRQEFLYRKEDWIKKLNTDLGKPLISDMKFF